MRRRAVHVRASRQRSVRGRSGVQGRPVMAAGHAQPLDHGRGHRRLRRRQTARLGHAFARDADRGRALRGTVEGGGPRPCQTKAGADGHLLQGGAARAGVRPAGQAGAGLGPGLDDRLHRLAARAARHLRRPQRLRLGRQLQPPPRDEVHARRQAPDDARRVREDRRQRRHAPAGRAVGDLGGSRKPTRPTSRTATATAA